MGILKYFSKSAIGISKGVKRGANFMK